MKFISWQFCQGGLPPIQTTTFAFIDEELHFRNGFGGSEKRRIRNILVAARAYFDKQGSLNMLSYLQALVILEEKSIKSSMVYNDIVTFIDRIDCFGFIKKNCSKFVYLSLL